tara:strand:+ start:623 stop:1171 length:549 start_codon:yes stop_codon:yes gene_type:complete
MSKPTLCDNLIDGFNAAKNMGFASPGRSARGVDKEWKDSEDVTFACLPVNEYAETAQSYREHMMECLNEYLKSFPILKSATGRLGFLEPPQIQRYSPGAAFFGEHYESSSRDIAHRALAFMTYLNSIKKGGGTKFVSQDFICKPRKGKTVIWPGGFTHTHQGVVAPDEEKYIITGWISHLGD